MSDELQHTSESLTDEQVEEQQRAGARRTAILLGLLVLVIAGAAFYYLWDMRGSQLADEETINVLLVGIVDHEVNENVEALVMASFSPQSTAVEAVALPVNTVLPWTARAVTAAAMSDAAMSDGAMSDDVMSDGAVSDGAVHDDAEPGEARLVAAGESAGDEADVAHVDGDQLRDVYAGGDKAALKSAVERLIGAPVHHTVRVDFSGFVELVDLLDGVSIDVQTEVLYRDAEGNVVFHLEPGLHRLTGPEALLYVRYKGDHLADDSRRVERQWQFVEAVLSQARTKLGWAQVQKLLGIAVNHVATDLDLGDVTRLLQTAFDMELEGHVMHMLPGSAVNGEWLIDADEMAALSERMFHNPSWQATQQ